ncbi:nucleotide-binding oligomerization domain-containing protein 2-like [Centruroides vittatus]|uniref:nucleotide-binding oligomerization domain-containing protein 2-like n=1 Tax=Centruroides vittatus TaxID=120091 RepID=UPI0035100428
MAEAEAPSQEKSVVVSLYNYKVVDEINNGIKQAENMLKDLIIVDNYNQALPILYKCKNVHTGPKYEIHLGESKASFSKKEDEERDEIFKNCSRKMKDKYETYFSYMTAFLWEGKRNDFPVEDYFVELIVEKADLFGKTSGEKISLNKIFAVEKDGHQTILVTGDPGYGKSTLCKKIAYDWASVNYLQHFQLTFIVILRELGNKSVIGALLDEMYKHPPSDKDWKLQDSQRNILVILDGFDEIVDKSKIIKFIRDESYYISGRMTIVVTSRPQAAEEIREDMKMRFSVKGFSPENQEKYIKKMFKEDESKADKLISELEENNFYREISECPLMLHMLCCLRQNETMEKLKTMTDLYIKIFTLITERYLRKTDQKCKFKKGKYFMGEDLLLKLVNKLKYSFTSKDLKALFPEEVEHNFIIGLDILTVSSLPINDNVIKYSFLHHTFFEFLSALLMYIENVSLSEDIREAELLFIFGLYKDKPLPKKVIAAIECNLFHMVHMLSAYREIKLKTNWKQFCSHAKMILLEWRDLIRFQEALKLLDLTEFYLYFHETPIEGEDRKMYVSEFRNYRRLANKLKINVIILTYKSSSYNLYDIREPVSRIISFCDVMNGINVDVNLIGVCCGETCSAKFHDFFNFDILHYFTNVNYNFNFSNVRESVDISIDEQLVALQCSNSLDEPITCILSLLEYEILRRRIKYSFVIKQSSKCVMM